MPMFVCLFWALLLLIDKQKANLSKRFLALFLGVAFLNYFSHAIYFNHQYRLYQIFESLWNFTSLAVYPLYYYYIRILSKDSGMDWRWIWIMIPAFAVAGFSGVLYLMMSPVEIEAFVQGILYEKSGYSDSFSNLVQLQITKLRLLQIVFILEVIGVFYFGIKHILSYNKKIKDFYSDTTDKELSSVKWMLIFFIFASFVSVFSSGVGKAFFVSNDWLLAIPSLTHSLFLFGIGYVGYKQDFTFEHYQVEMNSLQKDEDGQSTSAHTYWNEDKQKSQMINLLEKYEIYKQPELRITDLASMLNTNRTYASRLINEMFQTNFADLINSYRVKKAIELMQSKEQSTLPTEDIAVMSGFSSESSFYRAFKKETSLSPGDYRKKIRFEEKIQQPKK